MVNLGNELTDPKYNRVIGVVLPHPDDEIFPAGTIYRGVQNGCSVYGILLTHGEAGYGDVNQKEEIGNIRLGEMRASQKILGFELVDFHDYLHKLDYTPEQANAIDGKVDPNNEYLEHGLIRVIRDLKPSALLIPYEYDTHKDHRNVYIAAMNASFRAERPSHPELGEPHRVDRLFQYEIMNLMEDPTHLIDITGEPWEKVKEALKCHKSQIERDLGYLARISWRTLLRGAGISYATEINEVLNELWKDQLENNKFDADKALQDYISKARRAEALKATSLPKFW